MIVGSVTTFNNHIDELGLTGIQGRAFSLPRWKDDFMRDLLWAMQSWKMVFGCGKLKVKVHQRIYTVNCTGHKNTMRLQSIWGGGGLMGEL